MCEFYRRPIRASSGPQAHDVPMRFGLSERGNPFKTEEVEMIKNALASIAVKDVNDAARWYEQLLGRPGSRPMEEVVEWQLDGGGGLQVYELPERAGSGSFTAVVADVDAVAARLDDLGIDHPSPAHNDAVDTIMIVDPDGNHIAFAAAHDPELAS